MPDDRSVIIIGSGPSAVHAALPLVESGVQVTLIDGGESAPPILDEPLDDDFMAMREKRDDQYRWFLGEDLSGIPVRGLEGGLGGGMTSGNRSYVTRHTDRLRLETKNAQIIQSLARGGLGAVWGATCAYFTNDELTAMGLPAFDIQKQYDEVSEIIGVSGPQTRLSIEPALLPDHHATSLLKAAEKKWTTLDHLKIRVTQPHAAVLKQSRSGRTGEQYRDMDYYSDAARTVWRPQFLLDALQEHPNFQYVPHHLVDHIEETDDSATVFARTLNDTAANDMRRFTAKRIIVAAGAINSARILLKSLGIYDTPVPLLAKPHVFSACLHVPSIGKAGPRERTSLCQLLLIDSEKNAEGFDSGVAQLYSYRSLLLFRLLSSMPLPVPDALNALSILSPSLIIADIRFPVSPKTTDSIMLKRGSDLIGISLDESEEEHALRKRSLKKIHKASRLLGLYPLKTLWLPHGSSSHYAGTIPHTEKPGRFALTTDQNGKLHQAKHIFVADASVFRHFAPEPHTLTMMANARRIGQRLAQMP